MRARTAFAATALIGAATFGMTGTAAADSGAQGAAAKTPGVLSGTMAQVPVHTPVNRCDTVNVIGLLNPALGNVCINK